MIPLLQVTILTEDRVRRRGLLAEHGLALWVETAPEKVLFDTGQSEVLLRNAKALGIDMRDVQAIVLSHGHYDHGGGLESFPMELRWPRIIVHPDAFLPRFAGAVRTADALRPIGLPWRRSSFPDMERRLMLNTSTMQVGKGMTVCTGIPQTCGWEQASPDLLVEREGRLEVDAMEDEQLMVCQHPQGLVVVLGCAHRGVANSIDYVRTLFPDQRIQAVVGGMHLEGVPHERLEATIDYLRDSDVQTIVPLHCTGSEAVGCMRKELGERVLIACTGDRIEF